MKPIGMSDAEWRAWPNCPIQGCPNKCCLRLNSAYCWPHTRSNKTLYQLVLLLTQNDPVTEDSEQEVEA